MDRKYESQLIVHRIRDNLCGPLARPSRINGTRLDNANEGNVNGGHIRTTEIL